jgi:RimJ/RimL family protein N-acetyltransferase
MSLLSEPHPVTRQPIGLPVDVTAARKPEAVVLEGRFGRVERLDAMRHVTDLWSVFKDHDHIWTYMSYGPFAEPAAFRDWLSERERLEDPFSYAIVNSSNRAVGIATLVQIRPTMRVVEVGHIVYSPTLQRTPLATEAQYLLGCYVFETLGYRRYEWNCNALNAASRRAALRLGFTYEGTMRQHRIDKGRNRDTAWYSMLDSEWPARKRNLERWLSSDNFDAGGRQRASLAGLNDSLRREEGATSPERSG